MKEKKYFRNCPQCNRTLGHTTEKQMKLAVKNQQLCNSCGRKGELHWNYLGIKKNCKDCGTEIDKRSTRCRSCKQKHQIKKQGVIPEFLNSKRNTGLKHSKKTKKLMSEIAIKERRVKQLSSVNYNKGSIVILEKFGKENGLKLQHAENGGEFTVDIPNGNTYFLDGYDKEKNVVVEYIENSSWHYSPKKKKYHTLRRKEIIDYLGCKYYEILENS